MKNYTKFLFVLPVLVGLFISAGLLMPQPGGPKEKPPDGVDVFEPNNTRDKATPLPWDKEIEATIFPRGDRDFYRLSLDVAARVTIKVTGASPAVSLVAKLTNEAGNVLVQQNAGPGRGMLLNADLRAGNYFLEMYDGDHQEFEGWHGSDSSESRSPYRLLASAEKVPDPFEPNDTLAQAKPIALGKTHQFWIFPAGDRDFFRIDVPTPGIGELRISATNVPENIALVATVHPQNTSKSSSPGRPLFWSVPITKAGEYQLEFGAGEYQRENVWKGNNVDCSTLPIDLKVEFLDAGDSFEPNNTFAQAAPLPLGKEISATLYPAGDLDYFKFSIPEGKRGWLRAELKGLPDSIHPFLGLYDKAQREIRRVEREKGQSAILLQALGGGDYFLLVSARDVNNGLAWDSASAASSRTRYTLKADFTPAQGDEHEPNDTFEQAEELKLGQSRTCTLLPEGDNDYFRFTLKENDPDVVQFVVSGLNSRVFTRVTLFNEKRQRLATTRVHRDGYHVCQARLDPGAYYFLVSTEYASNGAYNEATDTQFQGKPYQVALVPLFRPTQVIEAQVHHLGDRKLNYFVKQEAEGLVFKKSFDVKDPGDHDALVIWAHYLPQQPNPEYGVYVTVNGTEVSWLNRQSAHPDAGWQTLLLDLPPGLLKAGTNEVVLTTRRPEGQGSDNWEFRQAALGKRLFWDLQEKGPVAVTRAELKAQSMGTEEWTMERDPVMVPSATLREFKLDKDHPDQRLTIDLKSRGFLTVLLPGPHPEVDPLATLYRVTGNIEQPFKVLYLPGRNDRSRFDQYFPEIAFTRVEPGAKEAAGVLLDLGKLQTFDAIVVDGLSQITQFDFGSEKAQANLRKFAEPGKRVLIVDPMCSLEPVGIKNTVVRIESDRTVDIPVKAPSPLEGERGPALGWPGPMNGGRIENWKEAGLEPLSMDVADTAKWAVTAYRPAGKGAIIFETMLLGHWDNQPNARRRAQWLLGMNNRLDFVTGFPDLQDSTRNSSKLGMSPILASGKYLLHVKAKDSATFQHAASRPMLLRAEFQPVALAPGDPGTKFEDARIIDLGDKELTFLGNIDEYDRELWYHLKTSAQRGARVHVECPEELDLAIDLYRGTGGSPVNAGGPPAPRHPKATGKKVLYLHGGPYDGHCLDQYFPDIQWVRREFNAPQANRFLLDPEALRGYDAIFVDVTTNEANFGLNQPAVLKAVEDYVRGGGRFVVIAPVCALPGLGIKSERVGLNSSGKAMSVGDTHEAWSVDRGAWAVDNKLTHCAFLATPNHIDEIGAFSGWAAAGYQPIYRHADNPEEWATTVAKKVGQGYYILDTQRVSAEDSRGAFDWKVYAYLGIAPSWEFIRTVDKTFGRTFGGPEQFELPAEDAQWYFRVADRKKCHWSTYHVTMTVTPIEVASAEEPNDTRSTATPLPFGKTLTGKLFPGGANIPPLPSGQRGPGGGDRDVYKLKVDAPGLLKFYFDHPADNIDPELTLVREEVSLKKVLVLRSGRAEYDLFRRRLAGVEFTTMDPTSGVFFTDVMSRYDAVILDGLTTPVHYGIYLEKTQAAISKYVEAGGVFILLCPQIAEPKTLRFWGVELVPGFRKGNIVVVDEEKENPWHRRRGTGNLGNWPYSSTFGCFTGWKEAGFKMIYADKSDKDKNATFAVKTIGKGMLILDALELGYPGNADVGNWHLANLLDAPLEDFLDVASRNRPGIPRYDERIVQPGTYYLTVMDNPLLGNYINASQLLYSLRADFTAVPELADQKSEVGGQKEKDGKDDKESPQSKAVDLVPGMPANALIWPAHKTLWYRFANPSPGKIALSLTNVSGNLDPVMELFRATDLAKPWKKYDNTTGKTYGGSEYGEFETGTSETYYVKIYDREGVGASLSPMRLQMDFSAVDCPFEPNNDDKSALPLVPDYEYPLNIYPARDTDWFRFTVGDKSLLNISITDVPADLTVKIQVFSADNLKTPWQETERKRGNALEWNVDLAKARSYFLVLRAGGNGAPSPGLFKFKASYQPVGALADLAVLSQWPAPNLVGNFPDVPIKIAFNRPIKAEGLDAALKVVGSRSGAIKGKVEVDPKTALLVFRSASSFVPGEKVSVTLSGVRDQAGKELAGKNEWAFEIGTPRVAETVVDVSLPRRKLGAGKHVVAVSSSFPLSEAPGVTVKLADGSILTAEALTRSDDGKWRGNIVLVEKTANGPARIEIAGKDFLGRKLDRVKGDVAVEIVTVPPPAMAPVTLEKRPQGKIAVTWTMPASIPNLAGYRLFRAVKENPAANDLSMIADITNLQTTFYEDVPPGDGSFLYAIAAVDDAGNVGPLSPFSRGQSVRSGPKLAVQDFRGKVEKGKVQLAWQTSGEAGVTGYDLYRFSKKEDADKFAAVRPYRQLKLADRETIDLPVDGEYYYLLTARDGAGNFGPPTPLVKLAVDTQPARCRITFAGKLPFTAGEHVLAIKVNEKLKDNKLGFKVRLPDGKIRELTTKALDDLSYQAALKLGGDDPDGNLQFLTDGEDLYGNAGVFIDEGAYMRYNNSPPRIRVSTIPEGKYKSGTVKVTVDFSEPLLNEPKFAFKVAGKPFPLAMKKERDQRYSGVMELGPGIPNGPAQFDIVATDNFNHTGSIFDSGRDFIIKTTLPGPPTNVRVQPAPGNTLLVQWKAPLGETISFFRLYAGDTADFPIGPKTLVRDGIGDVSFRYEAKSEKGVFLKVTSVDPAGNESKPSDANRGEPRSTPPPAVTEVVAAMTPPVASGSPEKRGVKVTWKADAIKEEVRFLVFRSLEETPDLGKLQPLASVKETSIIDRPRDSGEYFYHVVAEDLAGNRSKPVPTARVYVNLNPPTAEVRLSPVHRTMNYWGPGEQLWRLEAVNAGKLQVRLKLSAPVKEPPNLRYQTKVQPAMRAVDLALDKGEYVGEITVVPAKEDGILQFFVTAKDNADNVGTRITLGERFWIDSIPPEPPAKLTVEKMPLGKLAISWPVPPGEQVQHLRFHLYRDSKPITAIEGLKPLVVLDGELRYVDTPAEEGEYYYSVVAEDLAGNMSLPSPSAANMSKTTPPGPPTNLVASLDKQIRLTWSPSPEKGARYRLYRGPDEQLVNVKRRIADDITETSLGDLPQTDGTFYYAVTALDASNNESAPSNIVKMDFVGKVPRFTIATDPKGIVNGAFKLSAVSTLPLIEVPQCFLQVGGRSDPIVLRQAGKDGTTWEGSFELKKDHPNGTARFSLRGVAVGSMVGTAVERGGDLVIDTVPPSVYLLLSRPSPLPAGTHEVILTASEPLADVPQLLLTTLGTKPRAIPLEKDPTSATPPGVSRNVNGKPAYSVFHGSFTITKEDREGTAVFSFRGVDLAGNQAQLDKIYPFEISHQAPKPATNLKARSLAGGQVELSWEAPLYLAKEPFVQMAGYNVYRSTKPISDLDESKSVASGVRALKFVDSPEADGEFHYAVVSLAASGLVSPPTSSVKVASKRTMPLPPRIVDVKQLATGIRIAWETDEGAGGPANFKVLVWSEAATEPEIVVKDSIGMHTEYRPMVSGTYLFRVAGKDAIGNESALSLPQSVPYKQLAPVARLSFSKPLPWGEGAVEVLVDVNRPLDAVPKLDLVVGDKHVPVTLTGSKAQWKGKIELDKSLPGDRGVFGFKAVVKEQGEDLEGTAILPPLPGPSPAGKDWTNGGSEVRLNFTPPTVALRFGPGVTAKDNQFLLKAGKIDFTVESSASLKTAPKLTFTPQGKETVQIELAPSEPNKWLASLSIDEKLGNLKGLLEFEGVDLQDNVGKEITAGRNVLLRTQAPGKVPKLRATSLPLGRVRVDWTPPVSAGGEPDPLVHRFRVYRGDSKIASLEGLTPLAEVQRLLAYFDNPKTDGEYYYTVVPVDDAGNVGPPADSVSVRVDRTPPGPPRELVVSQLPSGAVKLSWKAPTGKKASFYRVYLQKAPIKTTAGLRPQSDAVPFTEIYGTPNDNGQYYFAVTSVDSSFSESGPSNVVFLDYKSIAPMAFFTIFPGEQPPEASGTITVRTTPALDQSPQLAIKGPGGQTRKLALTGNGATWTVRIAPSSLFPVRENEGTAATYTLEVTTTQILTEAPQVFFQSETSSPRAIPFKGLGKRFTINFVPSEFFRIDPRIRVTDGKYTVTLWSTTDLREPPKVTIHSEARAPSILPFTGSGSFWQAALVIDGKFPEGQYAFEFEGVDANGNVGTEVREGPLFRVERKPPLPPEKVQAVNDDIAAPGGVKISWNPPGGETPHFYRIFRSPEVGKAELVRTYRVKELRDTEQVLDIPPGNGVWTYRISSLDLAGNESKLSESAKVTVSTKTPWAEIRLSTPQSGDAPATRVGVNGAKLVLTTNVPLKEPPVLNWFLKSKPAEKHAVELKEGRKTDALPPSSALRPPSSRYVGELRMDLQGDVEEDADFEFLGTGEDGIEGRSIRSGQTFTVDSVGPQARIIIPSVYEMKIVAKPEGGGELRVPPVRGGRIQVNVELSEVPFDVPELKYVLLTPVPTDAIAVPLTGFGRNWQGWMDIPQGLEQTAGKFFFKAVDLAGNVSTKITKREYPRELDENSFPPRTIRNYATTGGDFEVVSIAPLPPRNVVLAARKLGVAEIRWDAPEEKHYAEVKEVQDEGGKLKDEKNDPGSSVILHSSSFLSYRLYRSLTPLVGPPPDKALKSDILARLMVDDPAVAATFFYAVTSVDLAGNESVLSESPSIFINSIKPQLKIKAVPEGDDLVVVFPEEDPVEAQITLRFPGQKDFHVSLGGDSGELKKVIRNINGVPTPAVVLPRQAGFFNGRVEVIVHSPDPEGNQVEALTETAYKKINSAVGGQVDSPDGTGKFEIPAGLEPVIPAGPKDFKRVSGYDQLYFISNERIPDQTLAAAKESQGPLLPDPVPPGLEVIGVPYTIHLNNAPQEPLTLKAAVTQADLSSLQALKPKLTMKIPEYYSDVVKDPEYLKSRLKVIKWVATPGSDSKKRGRWEMVPDIEINTQTGELITPADSITTYVIVSERTPPTVLDAQPEPNGSVRTLRPPISARIIDKGTGVAQGADRPIFLSIDGEKVPAGLINLTSDDPTEVKLTYAPPADLKPGMHLLAIRAEDVVGNVCNYQWRFTIVQHPPVIAGVNPGEGSVTSVARPLVSALLSDEGPILREKIQLQIKGLDIPTDDFGFDEATGLYTWQPSRDLPSGEHEVTLTVVDSANQTTTRNWRFFIDTEPPTIEPPRIEAGTLTIGIWDRLSAVDAESLRLFLDDQPIPPAPTGAEEGGFIWQPAQRTLAYALPTVLAKSRFTVKVLAQDVWGNHQMKTWRMGEGELAPAKKSQPPVVQQVIPPPAVRQEAPEAKPPQVQAPQPASSGMLKWVIFASILLAVAAAAVYYFKKRRK